ncbi:hypothetical protein ACJIZ3_008250 [Penstemon smallii]|uniref:Transcription factor CBF/NF-Y/archaeal histone domain-containing protein n=1 Tax=Penstemon smallii TaxID=265156 RepID=A0ABD3T983_9LAMI
MRQPGAYSKLLSGGKSSTGPHSLPLARIKKIMKKYSGDDVKMISGEAPIVFSKACELFIEELTKRAWAISLQGKRRTLQKEDVASAVITTDIFDFLVNLVSDESSDQILLFLEINTLSYLLNSKWLRRGSERFPFLGYSMETG